MKNSLGDLSNHLFVFLENLNDDEILENEDLLKKEIKRAETASKVAKQIIEIGKLQVNTLKLMTENVMPQKELPELLIDRTKKADASPKLKIGRYA